MLIISKDQDILYNKITGGSGTKPPKYFKKEKVYIYFISIN